MCFQAFLSILEYLEISLQTLSREEPSEISLLRRVWTYTAPFCVAPDWSLCMQNQASCLQEGAIFLSFPGILRMWPADTCSQYMELSLEIQKHICSHFSSVSSDESYSAFSHGQDRNAFFRGSWWAWQTHSCVSWGTWDEQIPGWQKKEHQSRKLHNLPVIFWWVNSGPSWTGLSQPCTAVWAACHTSRLMIYSQHWPLIRLPCHFPGPVLQHLTRNVSFTTWKWLLTSIELILHIC